jgi:ribosomal protein S9
MSDDQFRWHAVGRRKTSVARVYLTPGTGKWEINGRTLGDYFPRLRWSSTSSSRSRRRTPSGRST